jgi:hypothetical protein
MGNDILRIDAGFDEFAVDASAKSKINSAHRFGVKFPTRFAGFFLAANASVKRQPAEFPASTWRIFVAGLTWGAVEHTHAAPTPLNPRPKGEVS